MPSIYDIQIGQRFSFEVYPVAVLGNNFKEVRLEGTLSARSALAYGVDIQALHVNVFPSLPAGTPNDPFQYGYVRVEMPNGDFQIVGIPWIRPETIQPSVAGKVTMVFNDKTPLDVERMQLALASNGYRPDSVKVESS